MAKPASGLEQNHLSPWMRQLPSSWRWAVTSVALTSEPAPCSVMNMAPWRSASKSWLVTCGSTRSTSAGSPNLRSVRASESVMLTGQHRPNSACTNRWLSAYLAAAGIGSGQPSTPPRCDSAARPNSL
ncbi:Uncharacterised protein [Achromobacter sp. 2789STDY5608615]|nr:Uncharacterised protein [Achromobacter sp. 2789STDY5608615]